MSATPPIVDRDTYEKRLAEVLVREKAHTREGDAIAADRRRMPMVEVDATLTFTGAQGEVTLLDVFEGREQLLAYLHMWYPGEPAAGQCEGCTFFTSHVHELVYLHERDVTYAALCQGPYAESARYAGFMGYDIPWYGTERPVSEALLAGRRYNRFSLIAYLRQDDRVYETYWTSGRGIEVESNSYGLLDRTIYGRQEAWEDSPEGWPRRWSAEEQHMRRDGRPTGQWPRIAAGVSDDLTV